MIGESYYAIPMWLAAADKPPHLTTIVVFAQEVLSALP